MDYEDLKDFAEERNIATTEVDGEFGSGYPCTYLYYEPTSTIKHIQKLQDKILNLKRIVAEYKKERRQNHGEV